MSAPSPPEVGPADSYQLDSDEYDSEAGHSDMDEEEYDRMVEEAEEGYTPEEMEVLVSDLKERGLVNFLRSYILQPPEGSNDGSRSLRKLLLGLGVVPPAHLRHPSIPDLHLLPYTKVVLSRVLRRRLKLPHINTVDDALSLLQKAKNIIVLSGAGISTSCGIPDFRSATGLYAQLQEEGKYDLDDPQQMFDIHYFKEQPEVFYSFAKSIYPSNFTPSPCHRWIKLLEDKDKLLRNYTQNIDTLETLAGVKRVLQCHGSFATASCLRCKTRVPGPTIEPYIMRQEVPVCGICRKARDEEIAERKAVKARVKGKGKAGWEGEDGESDDELGWGHGLPGIMKPDITFFGQALDSEFDTCLFADREKVDLLLIIGTSLKVAPVNEVLAHIPHSVPQIFINLTPISHVQPDICLLGDADRIVSYLSSKLGWSIPPPPVVAGSPTSTMPPVSSTIDTKDMAFVSGVGPLSHIHQLVSKGELQARLQAAQGVTRINASDADGSDSSHGVPSIGGGSGSVSASASAPASGSSSAEALPAQLAAAADLRDERAQGDETSQPAQSIAEGTDRADVAADKTASTPASPNDRPSKRSRMVGQPDIPQ